MRDPVESVIAAALDGAGIRWVGSRGEGAVGLDFYLPDLNTHIECKRMFSDRITEQMQRAENVIVIQGLDAAKALAAMIGASGP